MNFFAKIGACFLVIIFIILCFTGLASFSLEVAKIALFNQTDGNLKLHPMDYVYLTAIVLGMGGSCCFHSTKSKESNKNSCKSGISGTIVCLAIMILYTVFTKDEMGDIPFFCPANYPYTSQLIRTACQVRAANLLIMWISPSLAVYIIIVALTISFSCCTGKDNCFV